MYSFEDYKPYITGNVYIKLPEFNQDAYTKFIDTRYTFKEVEADLNKAGEEVFDNYIPAQYLKEEYKAPIITDIEQGNFTSMELRSVGEMSWFHDLKGPQPLENYVTANQLKIDVLKNAMAHDEDWQYIYFPTSIATMPEHADRQWYLAQDGIGYRISVRESSPNENGDYNLKINITAENENGKVVQPEIVEVHNVEEDLSMNQVLNMLSDDLVLKEKEYFKVFEIKEPKIEHTLDNVINAAKQRKESKQVNEPHKGKERKEQERI